LLEAPHIETCTPLFLCVEPLQVGMINFPDRMNLLVSKSFVCATHASLILLSTFVFVGQHARY